MNFLITGGCGFLGSNISENILKNNKGKLFILDNLSRKGSIENLNWLKTIGNFEYYNIDIRNSLETEEIISKIKPDVVFHLAGQVAMTTSIANPRLDFEINILGTINILEAIRKHNPNAIVIYSSTNKVYGDLEWTEYKEDNFRYISLDYPMGFPENITLEFHSPYGCSKGAADQYMLDYYRIFGIKTVVFRHSSMYGGRQFSTSEQGWIGWFCLKALETKNNTQKDNSFTISGNGKQVRDLLYIDDLIELYFNSIEYIEKAKGQAFNIGGGFKNSFSLLELFLELENILKIKLNYTKLSKRESDQKVFIADLTKTNKILKWHPKVDKITGLNKMLNWVESGL